MLACAGQASRTEEERQALSLRRPKSKGKDGKSPKASKKKKEKASKAPQASSKADAADNLQSSEGKEEGMSAKLCQAAGWSSKFCSFSCFYMAL